MSRPDNSGKIALGVIVRLLLCGLLAFVLEHYLEYDERSASLVAFVAALVWLYFYFKRQEKKK